MKLVYVCSPYRADSEGALRRNMAYARELTREVLLRGDAAVTPHLYMTQCLEDADEGERRCGLSAGLEIVGRCDEIVVGCRYGITEGMDREIRKAKVQGALVAYMD